MKERARMCALVAPLGACRGRGEVVDPSFSPHQGGCASGGVPRGPSLLAMTWKRVARVAAWPSLKLGRTCSATHCYPPRPGPSTPSSPLEKSPKTQAMPLLLRAGNSHWPLRLTALLKEARRGRRPQQGLEFGKQPQRPAPHRCPAARHRPRCARSWCQARPFSTDPHTMELRSGGTDYPGGPWTSRSAGYGCRLTRVQSSERVRRFL